MKQLPYSRKRGAMTRRLMLFTVLVISVLISESDSFLQGAQSVQPRAPAGASSVGTVPVGSSRPQTQAGVGTSQNQSGGGAAGGSSRPLIIPSGVRTIQDGQYSITSARPLAVAAQLLSLKLGVPVSYEDATWLATADVTTAKLDPSVSRAASPSFRVPIVPRESAFDFTLPSLAEMRNSSQPETIIAAVIETYHRLRNPGQFKLIRFGEGEFSIAATAAGGKDGNMVPQLLPLDTRISFPPRKRSLDEAIEEICAKVTASGPIPLINNAPPAMYFTNNYTEIGADNEVARSEE